jgi:hypothetical protein
VHHERVVVALADDGEVFVLAETGEVERVAVDEESVPADPDRTYADTLVVAVHEGFTVDQLHVEVVEVAVAGRPAVHVRHRQRPVGALGVRHLPAGGVTQDDASAGGARGRGPVVDDPGGAVEIGDHRDVGEVRTGRRIEPDRAMDARVVEEVVPVALPLAGRGVFDDARRDRLETESVVDDRGDADLLAGADMIADVGLERRVAALMRDDLGVVHPDGGPMRGGLELEHDPLPVPAARHPHGVWYQTSPK